MDGYIYKVESKLLNRCYIGSTRYIEKRLRQHKNAYNIYAFDKKGNYYSVFDVINAPDVEIIEIEKLVYNNIKELKAREAFYIRTIPCVNKNISGRNMKQYYQDKKENYKRYYERHKARLLTYQMNYNRIKKNQLLIHT